MLLLDMLLLLGFVGLLLLLLLGSLWRFRTPPGPLGLFRVELASFGHVGGSQYQNAPGGMSRWWAWRFVGENCWIWMWRTDPHVKKNRLLIVIRQVPSRHSVSVRRTNCNSKIVFKELILVTKKRHYFN